MWTGTFFNCENSMNIGFLCKPDTHKPFFKGLDPKIYHLQSSPERRFPERIFI